MKFGLVHFKRYCKSNGVILTNISATRCDVPAFGGGDGGWDFDVDGIHVSFLYLVVYGIETMITSCIDPMPEYVFDLLEKYLEECGGRYGFIYYAEKKKFILQSDKM